MLKSHSKYPQRWISSKILDCSFYKGARLNQKMKCLKVKLKGIKRLK